MWTRTKMLFQKYQDFIHSRNSSNSAAARHHFWKV
uniref:Uncharacterized protein n=1 Tax=Rhizophora mucronata TaxID=61149 RepID=A0A2P2R431_RHIMU